MGAENHFALRHYYCERQGWAFFWLQIKGELSSLTPAEVNNLIIACYMHVVKPLIADILHIAVQLVLNPVINQSFTEPNFLYQTIS